MSYPSFDAFAKTLKKSNEQIAEETTCSKHVIADLRNGRNIIRKHIETFLKLKRAYPTVATFDQLKIWFPEIKELSE